MAVDRESLRAAGRHLAAFAADAGGAALAAARGWPAAGTRRWPLASGLVWVALFCLLSYAVIDRPLALLAKGRIGPDFAGFCKTVQWLGVAGVSLIPSGLAWLACQWRRRRAAYAFIERRYKTYADALLYLFVTVAASRLAVDGLKPLIGRLRPHALFDQGLYGFTPLAGGWTAGSFPSGHSVTAFALMTALSAILPRYDVAWFVLAALVAIARVATTAHYLSDAAMGAYLGIAAAILFRRLFAWRGIEVRLYFARDRKLAE